MGLRQRSNLVHLERCLHEHWSLGQNNILSWAPLDEGILILVVPHYAIAEYTSSQASGSPPPRVARVHHRADFRRPATHVLANAEGSEVARRAAGLHAPARASVRPPGGNADYREDDPALRHQLRGQPCRNAVRYCRLQPADAVRADDTAQQPFLLAELGPRQDARAGCRHQLRPIIEWRRLLRLEPRRRPRGERQPLPLHAHACLPTMRSRAASRLRRLSRGYAHVSMSAAVTSSTRRRASTRQCTISSSAMSRSNSRE